MHLSFQKGVKLTPLDFGYTPKKVIDAQVVHGNKMFLVYFKGLPKGELVPADVMERVFPEVRVYF
jgi:hypothetical protein